MGQRQEFRCIECISTRPGEVEIVSEFSCLLCSEIHRRIDVVPVENADAYLREAADIADATGVKLVEVRTAPDEVFNLIKVLDAKPTLHGDDDEEVAGHA